MSEEQLEQWHTEEEQVQIMVDSIQGDPEEDEYPEEA